MGQDIRHALRLLTRTPSFCAVAIVTLALGIGAATSVFTVVYTVLLRPLPYPAPERLVQVWERQAGGFHAMPSDPNFEDLHERNRSFRAFAQYAPRQTPVTVGDVTVQATTTRVSAEFFDVLRVHPSMGRLFLPEELHVGAAPVALVSDRFWRRHFAGRAELTGAAIRVGHELHTIAGVMPPRFDFPVGSDVWTPREQSDKRSGRTGRNSRAVARLGPDVMLAQARSDLSAIATHLKRQYGDDTGMLDVDLVPLQEQMVASVRPALLIQLVAAGFLLLAACANVLNLLLARAAARGRELAVRAALGAGRWRSVRQSVVESGMLSMAGCALGVLAAVWSLALIEAIAPAHLPRISELAVGWPVVGFALAAAIAISLLLGLAVAWRTGARQLHLPLHESRGTIGDHAPHRLRHTLVVVQVAVTLVLRSQRRSAARQIAWLPDDRCGVAPPVPSVARRLGVQRPR